MDRIDADDAVGVDEILLHIRECDKLYRDVYGAPTAAPRGNACKKLMTMGFELNHANLADLCIRHCNRWKLPEDKSIGPPTAQHGSDEPGCTAIGSPHA